MTILLIVLDVIEVNTAVSLISCCMILFKDIAKPNTTHRNTLITGKKCMLLTDWLVASFCFPFN